MSYSAAYDREEGIAIVGMAGRFPGARTVAQLWRNLLEARETISHFHADELEPAPAEDMAARASPAYVRARGILDDIEMFDAGFFGINPKEAEILDPQQRVFLETAWEALEDAGHDPQRFTGPIGVFAGASNNYYYLQNLLHRRDVTDLVGWLTTMMGNEKDYLTTRVAYKLDLKGPALNIQTACSTSLVAVCSAVQSLLSYQCDMALAGGVSITLPQRRGYLWQEGVDHLARRALPGVRSRRPGHGVQQRRRDRGPAPTSRRPGRRRHHLRRHQGRGAQQRRQHQGQLHRAERRRTRSGHLDGPGARRHRPRNDLVHRGARHRHSARRPDRDRRAHAGVPRRRRTGQGVLRDRLAQDQHRSPGCGGRRRRPDQDDAGAASQAPAREPAFHVAEPEARPRRQSVLRQRPAATLEDRRHTAPRRRELLRRRRHERACGARGGARRRAGWRGAQSAADGAFGALRRRASISRRARLKEHIAAVETIDLADAAYTLQTGRRAFSHRRALVCGDRDDALQLLTQPDPKRVFSGNAERQLAGVAFLFPGQGAQHVNMGRTLYQSEARFRTEVDECSEVLRPHLGVDLRTILYPPDAGVAAAQEQITQTAVTQPALFVIEYALARLWMSWGVEPAAMIGHSLGEYVAACLAGVFTRDDALRLLARRARMMQDLPSGSMLAVRASVDEIAADLGPRTSVAALNAPSLTVISGDHAAIAELEARLTARQLTCRRLPTSHAFHSPMMEPIVADFTEFVRTVPRAAPTRRWVSGLTGELITDAEATDPAYWAQQLRQPVRFMDGVGKLMDPNLVLLEVGPGQALTSLARQHPDRKAEQLVLTSLHPGQESRPISTICSQPPAGCGRPASASTGPRSTRDRGAGGYRCRPIRSNGVASGSRQPPRPPNPEPLLTPTASPESTSARGCHARIDRPATRRRSQRAGDPAPADPILRALGHRRRRARSGGGISRAGSRFAVPHPGERRDTEAASG